MIEQQVIVSVPAGIHAKSAAELTKITRKFESDIYIKSDRKMINAKSVLSLVGAIIKEGDEVTISCDGKDESDALRAVINFFIQKS
jgi:phosphocarrier protein HPr